MHLARGLSTVNTRKPKRKKLTQAQLEKLTASHKAYNKDMKRMGMHSLMLSFEDYILYVQGQYKPKSKPSELEEYTHKQSSNYRQTEHIPSLGNGIGNAAKKESQRYTGTLIKGIATMHKSNAVPIINQEQAIEVSNMRRN
jgi:hypothetical protein